MVPLPNVRGGIDDFHNSTAYTNLELVQYLFLSVTPVEFGVVDPLLFSRWSKTRGGGRQAGVGVYFSQLRHHLLSADIVVRTPLRLGTTLFERHLPRRAEKLWGFGGIWLEPPLFGRHLTTRGVLTTISADYRPIRQQGGQCIIMNIADNYRHLIYSSY